MAKNNIGDSIKAIRISQGMTQGELAEEAGISQTYLSQLETGEKVCPSITLLEDIASVFNCALSIQFIPVENRLKK